LFQQEELSEQQVRIGLVEKKLETASKDAEDKVDNVQRKLEDAQNLLRKKEKYVLRFRLYI
jgi:dynactin 1